ncbi:uncharacterized protein ColSpa_12152 [Colletotrichum spaethianum]|uniref:Uncharacterized protein n=1 Tax=Colletotrichum spaethianum TaxID=700344 RepID=A0AA37PGP4_9PEZI|nr:uncharacterized protein ColSpa_12152 [Colletotrichum spaethianum]GKT51971.1 hypothetical protein ColSpa_12152 [Colletotrichum spaethianum]
MERHIQHVANYGVHVASKGLRSGFRRSPESSSRIQDGRALPKKRLSDTVKYRQCDVDPTYLPGFQIGETSWLLAQTGKALVNYDTVYCIGLPKLAQQIHIDQQSHHASHRIQRMNTDDFNGIFLASLVSQKLESLHPFGEDLADPATFDALSNASPVRGFCAAFDTFSF